MRTGADRKAAELLRQIASEDVVVLRHEMSIAKKLAAQAYVVEQYGFEYGEAWREGPNKQTLTVHMYRDPRPEARRREAATIAAFPEAGNGGAVPGMQPGSLKPTAEAQEAVARLKDLIGFDVMSKGADKKQKAVAWGCCGVLVLTLLLAGMYVGALAGGALMAAFLAGAFKLSTVRRQRLAQRLQDAGFVPVQDERGRQRFLRPGQQLPGHANPFTG